MGLLRLVVAIVIAYIVALTGCSESEPQTVEFTGIVSDTADVRRVIQETIQFTPAWERVVAPTPAPATSTPEPSDQGHPDPSGQSTISDAVGSAQPKKPVYRTDFDEWLAREGHFAGWQKSGARLSATGELVLDPCAAVSETDPHAAGTYYGGNFYTGGTYWVGQATGPAIPADFGFDELTPSWNAVTPAGTWVEVLVRVELDGRWTKWYKLSI